MSQITRRRFGGLLAAAGAAVPFPWVAGAQGRPRVVVVGGGFGGATCARYLRELAAAARVTLVERAREFHTCPFSNLVLAGLRPMASIRYGYDGLRTRGVDVVHDTAEGVDLERRTVRLASGASLAYDRLVLSPGIDLDWNAVEGYDEGASERVPHAWKAGPQTALLRGQLEAMADGGLVILSPPANPYRCPPGPYERASVIAHYLMTAKPRSKVLILDPKPKFSKMGLFREGWDALYPGMIEWVGVADDGKVVRVDAAAMTLESEFGERHRGDVINFIPPQRAGRIARAAGLTDRSGWCPVDQRTFASTAGPDVHVIGDAAVASPMPKSGFSANSQGKIVAAAVAAALAGREPEAPSLANTCYSFIGPDWGISVAAVYRLAGDRLASVKGAGGVSPAGASPEFRRREARYAEGWYASITRDMFG